MKTFTNGSRGRARAWFPLLGLITLGFEATAADATAGSDRTAALGDFHGRPTVALMIAGEGPFTFILDTGADVSVVDLELQSRLGLVSEGDTEVGSPVGGTVEARRVSLPGLRVGDLVLGEVEALAIDLAALLGGGDAPVGVLATAAFRGSTLSIDFSRSRLQLSEEPLPGSDGVEVFDFCSETEKPSLTVSVGGRPFCVNVDTGSPGLLSLPLSAADSLPLASPPVVRGHARLVGAETSFWGAKLDGDLRIGAARLVDPELGFMETVGVGNLGQAYLAGTVLELDHANARLRIRPGAIPASAAAPARGRRVVGAAGPRRYGIRLAGVGGDELPVLGVEEGLPAELGGLMAGDVILTMNRSALAELDASARIAGLRATPLHLRVRRGGEELDLHLALD